MGTTELLRSPSAGPTLSIRFLFPMITVDVRMWLTLFRE